VLETNRSLVTIDMSGNCLRDAGLSLILKALKSNPNTRRYAMAENELSDRYDSCSFVSRCVYAVCDGCFCLVVVISPSSSPSVLPSSLM
jgi:hypothetical protein